MLVYSKLKPDPDFYKTVNSDEFLPPIQLWARLGGMALVATAGTVVVLASVTPYNVVVRAPATVRPTGEIRVVQATVEGVVNQIAVQENQNVKLGDVIAYLDDSLSQTQKRQLQGNIHQNQQQLAQIAAQMSALDSQQEAEAAASHRMVVSASADLLRSQRELLDQQISTKTELQEAEAQLELAKEEMARYQQLATTGAIPQLQIKQREQTLKSAAARWERAQAKVNPSNASVTIASEQISQEKARGAARLAKLQQDRGELVSKRAEVENQLNRDRQTLLQLERDRQKNVAKATSTGTILKLNLRNPGQVVHLGESIATIAPSQSSLSVKAQVAALDISRIQACLQKRVSDCRSGQVQLRISAYPYPDYGTLYGAVTAIAPDATTDQSNGNRSSTYYEVTVRPEKSFLTKGNQIYPIQSGMDATADIITKKETVLSFVLRKARLLTDL